MQKAIIAYVASITLVLCLVIGIVAGVAAKRQYGSSALETKVLHGTVRLSNGTGSIIGRYADGTVIILTAKHVGPGYVSLWPYDQWQGSAYTVAEHPYADLALLRMHYSGEIPGSLSIARKPPNGGRFVSAGCIGGANPSCLHHRIIGTRTFATYVGTFYETDQPAYPGCSGGPLVDPRGHVVGVCCFANNRNAWFSSLAEIQALCRVAGLGTLYD